MLSVVMLNVVVLSVVAPFSKVAILIKPRKFFTGDTALNMIIFSITAFNVMTLNIKGLFAILFIKTPRINDIQQHTLSITTLGPTTFNITTLSITTFSITTLSTKALLST